jgi:sulfate transport system permease protein
LAEAKGRFDAVMTVASSEIVADAPRRAPRRPLIRRRSAIPGFALTLGLTITILSCIVLIPLSAAALRAAGQSPADFVASAFSERALAAYGLSFGAAFLAALINGIAGLPIAWALVRYQFPGKTAINGLIDLPFALPTAVAGIALATIYAQQGWVGQFFSFKIAYTPVGVVIALIFVGLPFVVRTLEPIIHDLQKDVEEAAASLGARRLDTAVRVILPALGPAWLTGFAMAFARGVGEYGSVIFIAGNMPYKSEIAPLLIIIQLEEYNYAGAAAIAVVMLALSFVLLFGINAAQAWARRFS